MLAQLIAFIGVSLLIIVVPGPDLTLLLKNAAVDGRGGAGATATGIMTGNAVLAAAAVAGLTAVLAASSTVYLVLKIVGAVYLIYLGLNALRTWRAMRIAPSIAFVVDDDMPRKSLLVGFRQGLLSNLFNPKVAAFYLSLFPQFDLKPLSPLLQHAVLAITFWMLALIWYCTIVYFLGKAEEVLQRNNIRRRISALSGVILIGLGGFLLIRE